MTGPFANLDFGAGTISENAQPRMEGRKMTTGEAVG
jgi:hypothetical protein